MWEERENGKSLEIEKHVLHRKYKEYKNLYGKFLCIIWKRICVYNFHGKFSFTHTFMRAWVILVIIGVRMTGTFSIKWLLIGWKWRHFGWKFSLFPIFIETSFPEPNLTIFFPLWLILQPLNNHSIELIRNQKSFNGGFFLFSFSHFMFIA